MFGDGVVVEFLPVDTTVPGLDLEKATYYSNLFCCLEKMIQITTGSSVKKISQSTTVTFPIIRLILIGAVLSDLTTC